MRPVAEKITWWLLAITIVALYFFALDVPLLGPDEPRYAQVAREMFSSGDWITPTLGGFNWFEKPVLLYWLQISAYNIFGVSEFSARLGSAIFGLATCFCLFLLGRFVTKRLVKTGNTDADSSVRAFSDFPKWLGLIAATSIGIFVFSRGASFDIIVTFPITAALVTFFVFEHSTIGEPKKRYLSLAGFFFFIGIALIGKGLIGIVFPISIVFFYYLLIRKIPSRTFLLSLIWGSAISILIAGVWYFPMYSRHGYEFIDEFIISHHFRRFISNTYRHPQPFWFFLAVLPAMTIPWIPFFVASIWQFLKPKFWSKKTENESILKNMRIFAIAWLLVPLVFFSMSGSKLPGYILPALPAAVILTADCVVRFALQSVWRNFLLRLLAFATMLIVTLLLQFSLPQFAKDDSVKALIDRANSAGFSSDKLLSLHTISHNAEFYGASRLARSADGRQRKFESLAEIDKFMEDEKIGRALILVPSSLPRVVSPSETHSIKEIARNGELAVFVFERK